MEEKVEDDDDGGGAGEAAAFHSTWNAFVGCSLASDQLVKLSA